MQIDSELLATITAVGSSIITSSIGYGVLRQKVSRLEVDLEKHIEDVKDAHKEFVPKALFDAVFVQLKADLSELKLSMKEILTLIHEQANH